MAERTVGVRANVVEHGLPCAYPCCALAISQKGACRLRIYGQRGPGVAEVVRCEFPQTGASDSRVPDAPAPVARSSVGRSNRLSANQPPRAIAEHHVHTRRVVGDSTNRVGATQGAGTVNGDPGHF